MKLVLLIEEIYGVLNWEVVDLCKEFGPCKVNIKKKNAFCFVEFENAKDGEKALRELNGYAFGKTKLKVKIHRKIFEKKICFHFERGFCKFGNECKFLHPDSTSEKGEKPENVDMVHEEEVIKPRKIVTTSKPKGDYFRKALEGCQREVVEEAPKKTKALAHLEKCVKSLAKPTKKIAKEPKGEKKEVAPPKVAKVYKTPRKSNTSSDTWTSVSTKASKAPRPVKLTQEQIMRNELSGNLPRLYEDLNVIRDACRTTLSGGDLDLMFIMDCTSSMSSWISTC